MDDGKKAALVKKRLVVGMSGASGAILGIELLKALKNNTEWETHLVVSRGARETIARETDYSLDEVSDLTNKVYYYDDVWGNIASGTFRTEGMVIVPCSMKTVAGVANGYSDNLLLRAADVTIKEGRKLVIAPRECPLSTVHLRNLLMLSELGVVIVPPMLSYYNDPHSVEDMTKHIVGKILDKFEIELDEFRRWGEVSDD